MTVRRVLPALAALLFLGLGVALGAIAFGGDDTDGDDAEPQTTQVITAGGIPDPCEQALRLAEEAVNAAARAIAVAQARDNSAAGDPSAPNDAVVAEANAQATALRQQYAPLLSACEQAKGAAASTTVVTTTAP